MLPGGDERLTRRLEQTQQSLDAMARSPETSGMRRAVRDLLVGAGRRLAGLSDLNTRQCPPVAHLASRGSRLPGCSGTARGGAGIIRATAALSFCAGLITSPTASVSVRGIELNVCLIDPRRRMGSKPTSPGLSSGTESSDGD